MALVPRNVRIWWGADPTQYIEVGGTSTCYLLDGPIVVERSYTKGYFEFVALVRGDDSTEFYNNVAAFEAAFSRPFWDLKVEVDGQPILDIRHSTSYAGVNTFASCERLDDRTQSKLHAYYRVKIDWEEVADAYGEDGRRNARVAIFKNPADAYSIRAEFEYTAVGSDSATEKFLANYSSYLDPILTSLGGTWDEYVVESMERDHYDRLCRGIVTTEEILDDQSVSDTNDPEIRRHSIEIVYSFEGIRDSSDKVNRFKLIDVTFAAWVDKTVSLDLKWPEVASMLQTKVYGILGRWCTLLKQNVSLDYQEHKINITQTWCTYERNTIRFTETVEIHRVEGLEIQPVYSGAEYDADIQRTHTVVMRTTTRTKLSVTTCDLAFYTPLVNKQKILKNLKMDNSATPSKNWVVVEQRAWQTPRIIGLSDATQLRLCEEGAVIVERYVHPWQGSVSVAEV